MKNKIISLSIICAVLIGIYTSNAFSWDGEDSWTTMSRSEITSISDEIIDSEWSPKNDIMNFGYTENGETIYYDFYSSETYTGEAYSQGQTQEDWDEFKEFVDNTEGGTTSYGNDCSGFVSMCWKLLDRYNTTAFGQNLNGIYFYALGTKGSAESVYMMQGDALNNPGSHIVLFNKYTTDGIESMEQTPTTATRKSWAYSSLNSYRPMRRSTLEGGFAVYEVVETSADLNVRSCAGLSCSILATQPAGSVGTIVDGSQDADEYRWWEVRFSDELSGWSVEGYLKPSSATPDLSITSSDISIDPPGPVEPGSMVNITATIWNDGGADATCNVWIYYDDQAIGTCVTIENFYGISVDAGEKKTLETIWNTTGLETTIYPVYVVISNSSPEESNTDNNIAHVDYAVPIEFAAFSTKRQTDGTVLIHWQTASETSNDRWNIWRRPENGEDSWEKLNKISIPGAGTAPFGEQYQFIDKTADPEVPYFYRLEWFSKKDKVERSEEFLLGKQIGSFSTALMEDNINIMTSHSESIEWRNKEAENDLKAPYCSAEYAIIVPKALKQAIEPLAQFRRNQGYRVKIVVAEDIYALFSAFSHEKAIRNFLRFAYDKWMTPRLRYVLLVGDAVMMRNKEQIKSTRLLPTFVIKMPDVGLIPSDYPYACLSGNDLIPELVVGRLPARSVTDVKSMARKIIRYENSPPSRNVIFAIGDYVMPGDEYAEMSSESIIRDYCEGLFNVTRIYTMPINDSLQQYQGTADDLSRMLNRGCSWLEFRGHGAASLWAGLLDAKGAKALRTTGQLPIIDSVSCFTGFFADDNNRLCISEALLRNPVGGAVAYIGNTGHGMIFTGHDFSRSIWEQVVNGKVKLGDAVFNAKKSLAQKGGDKGFLHSINLLGDPATTIKIETLDSPAR